MGGFNSGRTGQKRSTDSMHRLDIRKLRDSITTDTTGVTLFQQRKNSDTEMTTQIAIDRTECNYGGSRAWWLCPRCSKRIAVLWGDSEGYACRHCQRLSYASDRVAKDTKPFRRANKVRERLGWGGGVASPPGDKPPGMHWRTYLRLMTKLNRHSIDAMRTTDKVTARIKGKLASLGLT